MVPTVLFVSLLSAWPAAQATTAAQPSAAVACEFRVFDAGNEITHDARVRVYPSGQREKAIPVDGGHASLAPGLYDVQAIRERDGQVTGIRWIQHLLIQRYPDEGGRHLEILNFKPQYGALELRTGGHADYEATAYAAGEHSRALATAVGGPGYLLLVVPAGRYDVRVTEKGASRPDIWLLDIDVPQERTRLRTVGDRGVSIVDGR